MRMLYRVGKYSERSGRRYQLAQEIKSLGRYVNKEHGDAREVAPRTVEACYEAGFDRVNADEKDDRNFAGDRFGGKGRIDVPAGKDHVNPTLNQLCRQRRQSIVMIFREAIFDGDIRPLDIATLTKAA
jgi:hypothetical protein